MKREINDRPLSSEALVRNANPEGAMQVAITAANAVWTWDAFILRSGAVFERKSTHMRETRACVDARVGGGRSICFFV